jgi:hypothetical protein
MSRIHRFGADSVVGFFGRSVSLQNVRVQISPPPPPGPDFSVALTSSIEQPLSLTAVITILSGSSSAISQVEISLQTGGLLEVRYVPFSTTIVLSDLFSLNATDEYTVVVRFVLQETGTVTQPKIAQPTTIRTFPLAPTGIAVTNIGVSTATLTFDDFQAAGGYSLEGATAVVQGSSDSLTSSVGSNTSVNLSALTPATEYSAYTLALSKTGFNPSPASPVPTFVTLGPEPSSISYTYGSPETSTSIIVNMNNYTAFTIDSVTVLDNSTSPATPLTVNNITQTGFELISLSPGTVYSATGTLSSSSTPPLQSAAFPLSFVTRNVSPQNFAISSLTDTTATFSFDTYSATPALTQGTVFLDNGDDSRVSSSITPTSIQISGLTPNTTYTDVSLVVENGIWQSLVSNTIASVTTYYTPPALDSTPALTCNSAEFSLSSPFVDFTVGGVESEVAAIYDDSSTPAVIRFVNLTPETEYANIEVYLYETLGGNRTATFTVPTFTTNAIAVDTNELVYESLTTTSESITLKFQLYEFSDASPILEIVATGQVAGGDAITFTGVLEIALPPTSITLRGPEGSALQSSTEYLNIQVKVVNQDVCLQSAVVQIPGSATTQAA